MRSGGGKDQQIYPMVMWDIKVSFNKNTTKIILKNDKKDQQIYSVVRWDIKVSSNTLTTCGFNEGNGRDKQIFFAFAMSGVG